MRGLFATHARHVTAGAGKEVCNRDNLCGKHARQHEKSRPQWGGKEG